MRVLYHGRAVGEDDDVPRHRGDTGLLPAAGGIRAFGIADQRADVLVSLLDTSGPDARAEDRTRGGPLIVQVNRPATSLAQGRREVDRATSSRILLDLWVAGPALPPEGAG